MPSPVYQNMINLIVGFPIQRCPSIFMDFVMWEHRTFDCEIFRCGKVHYSNSIIITDFIKLHFHKTNPALLKTFYNIDQSSTIHYISTLFQDSKDIFHTPSINSSHSPSKRKITKTPKHMMCFTINFIRVQCMRKNNKNKIILEYVVPNCTMKIHTRLFFSPFWIWWNAQWHGHHVT
jgi:hypothetical protein